MALCSNDDTSKLLSMGIVNIILPSLNVGNDFTVIV